MKLRRERRALPPDLQDAMVVAERAAQRAYELSFNYTTPYLLRSQLGRAQSLLIHNVVKYNARPKGWG